MNCYFCLKPLSRLVDGQVYYACKHCKYNDKPYANRESWKPIHLTNSWHHDSLTYEHVYFHSLRLFFCVQHKNHISTIDYSFIVNNDYKVLFRIDNVIVNIFKYKPDELESKIKTWLTFS